jgi:hypothetical protein
MGKSALTRACAQSYIHLSQHFKTVQFLTSDQIKRDNVPRGYAEDPCKRIPEMHRRHMGCK